MSDDIQLLAVPIRQFCIRLDTAVISESIPASVAGAYVLMVAQVPVYVGRSDYCLRSRLLTHELLGRVTHFCWRITRNAVQAYYHECAWFHGFRHCGLWNNAHPGQPRHTRVTC